MASREVKVVLTHGDEKQWASWLADVRTAIFERFEPGDEFYEKWLASAVSDPSCISLTVKEYIDEIMQYDREALVNVLVYHRPRQDSSCHCGWAELGRSWPEHIANVYEMVLGEEANGS